jgi:hypothetical protein
MPFSARAFANPDTMPTNGGPMTSPNQSSVSFALNQTASVSSGRSSVDPPRRAARPTEAAGSTSVKGKPHKTKSKFRTALNEWMGHMSGATTPAQNFRKPLPISTPLPPSPAALASAAQEKERQQNMDKIRQKAQNLKIGGANLMRRLKKKLSSKTPKEELPKTFEEYSSRYANVSSCRFEMPARAV